MEMRRLTTPARVGSVAYDYPSPSAESGKITGYAAVYWDPRNPGTEYRFAKGNVRIIERINPRAFERAIREDTEVVALFNHDTNYLLGRVSAGTLRLSSDSVGLRYEVTPPNNYVGDMVRESLRRRDLKGSSFSFGVRPGGMEATVEKQGGQLWHVHTLTDLRLFDVAPCVAPAYAGTSAEVRTPMTAESKELAAFLTRVKIQADLVRMGLPSLGRY